MAIPTEMKEMPQLLTCRETSEVLRVHPDTVRAMLSRGELEGFQSRKTTRITLASIERLVGETVTTEPSAA